MTSRPSTITGRLERLRSAVCRNRAVFRDVDPVACEHVVTPAGDILLAGKVEQQPRVSSVMRFLE